MIKVNKKDLNLKSTLLSGQCFRVKEFQGKYTVVLKDRVVLIEEDDQNLNITSNNYDNLTEIIEDYFDLNTDYRVINETLSSKDDYIKSVVSKCEGYKILRQDSFEMYIAFIISQNNSVKRISNSIEKLSFKFGKKVSFNNENYYLFPTFDELKDVKIDDLKDMGLGYRDKFVINAIDYLKTNKNLFKKLNKLDGEDSIKELLKIKGVGLKVASCILLFGFYKLDVFPIDRWVKKNISINYNKDIISEKEIMNFTKKRYSNYSAVAIQYMFHSERNKGL